MSHDDFDGVEGVQAQIVDDVGGRGHRAGGGASEHWEGFVFGGVDVKKTRRGGAQPLLL